MKTIIFVVLLFIGILAADALSEYEHWENFKVTHNKTYKTSVEEGIRFAIFCENLQTINDHNDKYDRGEETFTMGVNKFADMTREEFSQFLRKFRKPEINGELHKFPEKLKVPDAVDWRDQNAVLEVKDQGDCGSCWAFSATGALEAQNVILNGKSVSLSEQQLLDCSGDYGNGDCDVGGLMTWAFDYVIDNGIVSEADYPYEGKQGTCRASSTSTILKMTGYEQLEGTEESLKNGVGTVGPISGAIYAEPFQFYESGIFSSDSCYNNELYLDHAVLTVGYGVENDQEFWIVKNSWGASWGENGYLRLARNADNQCGIALATWYPVL